MNKNVISKNQISDAGGELSTIIEKETSIRANGNQLLLPSYTEIQTVLKGSERGTLLRREDEDLLKKISGARGIASLILSRNNECIYAPAVVVDRGKIAVLSSYADMTSDLKSLASFTDLQQTLLASAYVQQRSQTGEHTNGVAEIGHSTMIAVADQPINIHNTTHQLVDSGVYAHKISQKTTISSGSLNRPTDVSIIGANQIHALTFLPNQQTDIEFDDFTISAGFALAAIKTQSLEGRKVNTQENLARMIEQMR